MMEQNEEYLDYIKVEEKSIIEDISNEEMQAYSSNLFEDVRHERSSILVLSLTDPDILKQSKFTDDEINIFKNLALDKLHCQKGLKDYFDLQLYEKNSLFNK